MENIISRTNCTGCTACVSICPTHAIKMIEKEDGFKYPVINQNKCINCGLCKKSCPVLNTKNNFSINECYVAYSKKIDEDTSSGGIFPIIANLFLENNGIVIGVAFDENNNLKHIAITEKNKLNILKGSKYLQSDLNNIFSFVKDNIKDKKILFVGTPCQVAGIKSFLKKDYENLFCIDLICHGVPSPKLFNKYIKELEIQNQEKLLKYNFRDKKTGWNTYSCTAIFKNKKVSQYHKENNYMKLFLSNVALRECCYNCNFKLGNKYSDITLGDFWGVKKYYPEMYNKNGVSAIIINSINGKKIFELIKDKLQYKQCKLIEIVDNNPTLQFSSKFSNKREKFFKEIDVKSIEYLSKKYGKKEIFLKKILLILKKIKGKICNS